MLPQIKQNMYLLKVNYELNEISKKVKAISAKRLTIDLINGYKIFKDAKYFSWGIFQNYLEFIPTKKHIECFSGTNRINSENVMECQKNIENITKSDSNFAPTFVGYYLLPAISFNV